MIIYNKFNQWWVYAHTECPDIMQDKILKSTNKSKIVIVSKIQLIKKFYLFVDSARFCTVKY